MLLGITAQHLARILQFAQIVIVPCLMTLVNIRLWWVATMCVAYFNAVSSVMPPSFKLMFEIIVRFELVHTAWVKGFYAFLLHVVLLLLNKPRNTPNIIIYQLTRSVSLTTKPT